MRETQVRPVGGVQSLLGAGRRARCGPSAATSTSAASTATASASRRRCRRGHCRRGPGLRRGCVHDAPLCIGHFKRDRRGWRVAEPVVKRWRLSATAIRILGLEQHRRRALDRGPDSARNRHVIQDVETATLRREDQIVTVDEHVRDGRSWQVELERLPARAVIERRVESELRPGEQQALANRILRTARTK